MDSSVLSGFSVGDLTGMQISASPSISPVEMAEPAVAPQIQAFRSRRNKDEERKHAVLSKMPKGWFKDTNLLADPLPAGVAGPEPAAVYRRISTLEQKDSSIDRQGGVEGYAGLINCFISAVYDDKGKSGRFKAGRPELLRMMKDAKAGKFKKLILEYGNRLSRDLGLTTSVFRDLRSWGVEIHTPAEGKWNLLHAAFNGVMSQEALENLKVWVRAGMERAVLDGKFPGTAPYGFEKKPGYPGELYEVEKDADHVRWIYSMRGVGVPPAEIKRLLNAKGTLSPRGKRWSTTQVCGILRNPIYIGLLIYFRTKSEKIETDSYTITRKVTTAPMSAWRVAERPDWEIVTVELWNRVQQLDERRASKRNRSAKRLLTGILKCSHCGSPMYSHNRRREHVRIQCSDRAKQVDEANSKRGTTPCHSRRSVLMQCIEVVAIQVAAERMTAVGAQVTAENAYKSAAMKEIEKHASDRKKLEAEEKEINARFAATFMSAYTGDMPEGAIASVRKGLNEELERVHRDMVALPIVEIPDHPLEGMDLGDLGAFLKDFPYCKSFDITEERESRLVATFQELVGDIEIDALSARSFNMTIRGPLAYIGCDPSDPDPTIRIEARDVELRVAKGPSEAVDRRWNSVSIPEISINDEEWALMAPSLPREPIWIEGYPKPIELRHVIDLLIFKQRSKIGFSYLKALTKVLTHWDHPITVLRAALEIAKFWNVIDLFADVAGAKAPRLIDGIKVRLKGRRSADIDDIPGAFDRRNRLKKARALDPTIKLSLPDRYGLKNVLT